MINPDQSETSDVLPGSLRYWRNLLLWSLALGIYLPLAIAPIALWRDADTLLDWLAIAGLIVAALVGGVIMWKTAPDFTMGEPRTKRGNRIRWMLVAIALIGPLIAYPLIAYRGPNGEKLDLFSNASLPLSVALPMIAVWAIAMPLLAYVGNRNLDDFNRSLRDYGMMVAGTTVYFLAPIWWMGWRAGLLPRPDVMAMFIGMAVIVNGANLWKRYHG